MHKKCIKVEVDLCRKTDERHKRKTVKVLNAQLTEMEFQNEQLKDEIEKLLWKSPIETFSGGRYSDNFREVYHYLTAQGISCQKVKPLIRMVLDKLVNEEIDRLPKKSLIATMPAEADLLSKCMLGQYCRMSLIVNFILMVQQRNFLNFLKKEKA